MIKRASDQIDLTKVVDGKDGTSVTILGSYNTMAELETAHPTGSRGDAYMVAGDLVIWNGTSWENVGRIQGPQGDPGTPGAPGTGVSSVQPQYYLSTSDQSATGGTWGNTITFVSGLYIWSRDEITYSNGSVDHSTEVYNQALTIACENAISALAAAQAVNQYTWHTETDTGAGAGTHITAIPKDDFLADPDNGGYNTLFDNIGMKIRNGLRKLASYGVKAIIGEENNARIEIAPTRVAAYDNHNVLGFSVESGADSGNVQISEFAQPFANLGNNETAAYTLTETPVANTKIYVEIDSYAFNPTIESIEFTAGNYETKTVSGVTIANTVTVAYSATNVITITNNLNEVIYTGRIIYTANRANAVVNIPASLIVHETDITKALFSPTLISTGISAFQSRATLDSGGYFDIGKWRYVDIQITIDASSLGTHNTWALFDGFATPANYYAGLSAGRTSFGNPSDSVYMFYINGNGRLCVSTAGTALAQNTQLTITGWYLKA